MERLQAAHPKAHFVKAFNSVGSAQMVNPSYKAGRPTMFLCGNDDAAKKTVTGLLDELGWEAADMGGVEAAMSAVESLTRGLSAELAPHGIRVVGLRPHGMPESDTIKEVFGLHAKAWGISWEQFQGLIAGRTHAQRLSSLTEMASMAVFAASDQASGLTGTILNLSLGSLDD